MIPRNRAAPSVRYLGRLKHNRCDAKYILKRALFCKLLYSQGLLALLISVLGIIHFWLRVFRVSRNSCLWFAVPPRDFWQWAWRLRKVECRSQKVLLSYGLGVWVHGASRDPVRAKPLAESILYPSLKEELCDSHFELHQSRTKRRNTL